MIAAGRWLLETVSSAASPDFSKGWVHRGPGSEKIVLDEGFVSEAGGSPMRTECRADLFGFAPVEGHAVVAAFDGGRMSSEAGAMLWVPPTGRSGWWRGLPAASPITA